MTPAGLGAAWMRQFAPFHRSASITDEPLLVLSLPAATQAVAELHDIPANPEPIEPAGACVTWMRQRVPFHRSASGTLAWESSMLAPPAVQAVAEVQDTARNSLPIDLVGLTVAWMLQAVPFHRSASEVPSPWASVWAPAAVQARAEVQETAKNPLSGWPAGLGTGWIFQPVPVQISASGWMCRAPSV